MMLLQAAADQWNVPVAEVSVTDGVITHGASGRRTSYGKVADAAAKLTPPDPASITLKDPKDWKIAGKPMKRLDTADKLNGSKVYAIDLTLPGMLHAAIKACPVFGGKLVSYDEAKVVGPARRPPRRQGERLHRRRGRRHVVAGQDRARRAADRVGRGRRRRAVERDDRRAPRRGAHGQGRVRVPQRRRRARRDPGRGEEGRGGLQHAVPGPRHDGADELHGEALGRTGPSAGCRPRTPRRRWPRCPSSRASRCRSARSTGTTSAGGFGRRGGNQDYVRQAALIAKQFPDVPVKLVWSREEDMGHDFYRPISQCKLAAGLDDKGALVGLHVRVSGQSINAF